LTVPHKYKANNFKNQAFAVGVRHFFGFHEQQAKGIASGQNGLI
jgi:hypothetical protein